MIPQLLPMLAVSGKPFDSSEHVFEVKWDGIRALAAVESGGWRLWGRDRADYQARYPELQILQSLPVGTLLDGELVVLGAGTPSLPAILRRHGMTNLAAIRQAGQLHPATYIVFDVLFSHGKSVCGQPYLERRKLLANLLADFAHPRLAFSQGIDGSGQILFAEAVAQGHEGIMAKHAAGRYLPGRRSRSWLKIKPRYATRN